MMKLFKHALQAMACGALITLTACLGRTATPGTEIPQGNAPQEAVAMISQLDSLTKAKNGDAIFGLMSNVLEQAMEFQDRDKARSYLEALQQYLTANRADIEQAVSGIAFAEDAKGQIAMYCETDIDQMLASLGYQAVEAAEAAEETEAPEASEDEQLSDGEDTPADEGLSDMPLPEDILEGDLPPVQP